MQSHLDIKFTTHDAIPAEAAEIIDTGLGDSNSAAAPLENVKPIACFAYSESGEVVGGAIGELGEHVASCNNCGCRQTIAAKALVRVL
jgi:hypothetical protein